VVDDNSTSIAAALQQERVAYARIVKQLRFILPTSVAQGMPIAITGISLPLTAIQG
jgi:hypothetical protein